MYPRFHAVGRRLAAALFHMLCLCALLHATAQGAAPADAANPGDTGYATVYRLRGEVVAKAATGDERGLKEGDRVRVGEKIRAAANAEAVLKTEDAGMVAVRPGAEFVAERFAAVGNARDGMALRLLSGSLRVITGWIGRTNRRGHLITTPTATIGIRGTDHEPYVLVEDRPAADAGTPHRAGTYDKVNRGGTTLSAAGESVDIDPGRVGFARAESGGDKGKRSRALMTLLLPVLLDKIPDFYVPGEFDAELDRYSQTVDDSARKALEQKLKPAARCTPKALARSWLDRLDQSIHRADAPAILALFAPDVAIHAIVRRKDGSLSEVDFSREELVQGTLATVKQLAGYQHRRISVAATQADAGGQPACSRLEVKSVVIEQGRLSGKPYRFESTERYVLELRDGEWLATRAETTQR